MKVIIVRHGYSTHLIGRFQYKANRREYLRLLEEWRDCDLTEEGRKQVMQIRNRIPEVYHKIYHSPVYRAQQSAAILKKDDAELIPTPLLTEIETPPPWLPSWIRIKVYSWFMLCSVSSLLTFNFKRFLGEVSTLLRSLPQHDGPILLVSHKVRIIALILYAKLHPKWKVLQHNTDPAGITIIESKA